MKTANLVGAFILAVLLIATTALPQTGALGSVAYAQGIRAGGPLLGLTPDQSAAFTAGRGDFNTPRTLADGLGPRFNLTSCGGCHAQPAIGGSSPLINPQITQATANEVTALSFIALIGGFVQPAFSVNGPVRVVRFKRTATGTPEGNVHNTATITGRAGAVGCV